MILPGPRMEPSVVSSTPEQSPDAASVLESLLRERWSCRAFLPHPVPESTIRRLLTIAQRSPSWCNTQPWTVRITSGEGTERFRNELIQHVVATAGEPAPDFTFPQQYTGVRRERRRAQGWQLYAAVGVERGDHEGSLRQTMKNFELFGAPHVAIITIAAELGTFGAVDGGIYVGAWLLAAQALGIAAIPQAAIALQAQFVREHFSIPDDELVLLGISFGYPDREHPVNQYRTGRAEIDEAYRHIDR